MWSKDRPARNRGLKEWPGLSSPGFLFSRISQTCSSRTSSPETTMAAGKVPTKDRSL